MYKTSLYHSHIELGAKMTEFAGWAMPIMYSSIIEEHNWTRENIGLFDVSHMGRLEITGAGAAESLSVLCTQQIIDMEANETRYSLMCNSSGGILDDLMISRLNETKFYVVCNASNREKIIRHIEDNLAPGTTLIDRTFQTAMLAIQGPKVAQMISRLFPGELTKLAHRKLQAGEFMGISYIAFRGGYTGEDGFEIVIPSTIAPMLWAQLIGITIDDEKIIKPVGLGARDTLRLEAGLPLYGHELTEQIDPLTAGLKFAVCLEKDFIGKEAIEKIANMGVKRKRIGLKLKTKRAARQGYKIFYEQSECGYVTSGCFAPTLKESIAMGYVNADVATIGNIVEIEIGKNKHQAEIVKLPFYRRKKD